MEFCTPTRTSDLVLVRIPRGLDFQNADEFLEECRTRLAGSAAQVLLVFEEGTVLDSAGMGAIIRLYRVLADLESKGTLGFVNHSDHVRAVFGMTGFERLLQVYETEEEAIDAMR